VEASRGKLSKITFKDPTRLFHTLSHTITYINPRNPVWIESTAEGIHAGFYLNEIEDIKQI